MLKSPNIPNDKHVIRYGGVHCTMVIVVTANIHG